MGQSVDRCDVVILGGGPAGSSTALSLRRHEPSLSVVLVEKTRYADRRIGETLPPMAKVFLDHLHVWDAFQAQGHRFLPRTVMVQMTGRMLAPSPGARNYGQ